MMANSLFGDALAVSCASAAQARVLVVDDDDDMRGLVAAALRLDGHDVVEASSALDALTHVWGMMLVGMSAPDVVVTDVRMPAGGGQSLISGLRLVGCKSPVVLMTAYDTEALRARREALEVAVVLDKPIEIDELRTMVVKLAYRA